jgi:UDP-N-acetylmuramate--alanine ligase
MRGQKPAELHLHFIGIGGIGMSGIAEVFRNRGYCVSGSDAAESETTRRLSGLGIRIDFGHRPENVDGANVVVHSSAIRKENPELVEARRRKIPVIPRAEALGELMRGKIGVAIAGTHGKTTTTTMMATVLSHAGLDPTIVIGGKVDAFGGNAKLGNGDYVVVEADESDGSFLYLPAYYAAITNVDSDHLDHYGDLSKIDDAFCAFVSRLPFFGVALVCGDDPGVKRNLARFSKPYRTYGVEATNHLRAEKILPTAEGTSFEVVHTLDDVTEKLGGVRLQARGMHNVRNALAVVGLSLSIGIPFDRIQAGLEAYRGVRRRFERRYEDSARGILVIDDYGHHPTEIEATLDAARALLASRGSGTAGRILLVFQPHRYSRTLNSADAFADCFSRADVLCLTDIYAAGEDPIPGVDGEFLPKKVRASKLGPGSVVHRATLEEAAVEIADQIRDGDLILCMGAGSVTKLPDLIVKRIEASAKKSVAVATGES